MCSIPGIKLLCVWLPLMDFACFCSSHSWEAKCVPSLCVYVYYLSCLSTWHNSFCFFLNFCPLISILSSLFYPSSHPPSQPNSALLAFVQIQFFSRFQFDETPNTSSPRASFANSFTLLVSDFTLLYVKVWGSGKLLPFRNIHPYGIQVPWASNLNGSDMSERICLFPLKFSCKLSLDCYIWHKCLQDRCDPVMTAYKLVTVDAPYWGFGYRMEQALLAVILCLEYFWYSFYH